MRKKTEFKRIQIVERNDHRKFLAIGHNAPQSIAEFCLDRGEKMMTRLIIQRLKNPRPYKLGRPLDVMCMMIQSYALGYKESLPGGLGSNHEVKITEHGIVGMINAFQENSDLTDTVMGDIVMHYIGRYSSLFNTFYGEQLRAQGVEEES